MGWSGDTLRDLHKLADPNGSQQAAGDELVTQCSNESWCLGNGTVAQGCCDANQGYNITTTGSSFAVFAANGSTSSIVTTTPTPESVPGPSTNVGAIAGGVVGGLAALFLLIGAAFLLFRRRQTAGDREGGQGVRILGYPIGRSQLEASEQRRELEAKEKTGELSTVERPAEMYGGGGVTELPGAGLTSPVELMGDPPTTIRE